VNAWKQVSENLLREIQNEAVDGDSDLPSLLRKCRILAQRLGNESLKNWVVSELDGYPPGADLPDYRIYNRPVIIGHYLGPMGSSLSNVQIPESAIDEQFREGVLPVRFYQSVSELEVQSGASENGSIQIAMPPEYAGIIRYQSVAAHLQLAQFFKVIHVSVVEGILDTVRNRILNFTLELEEFASSTGDPLRSLKEEHPREIQQVFNTTVLGDVGNLNQGGDHVSQTSNVQKGDLEDIGRKFTEVGLSPVEVAEFQEALSSESPNSDGTFGQRVSGQFGKAIQKAGGGLLKISSAVASNLLAHWIKGYYGM